MYFKKRCSLLNAFSIKLILLWTIIKKSNKLAERMGPIHYLHNFIFNNSFKLCPAANQVIDMQACL